VTSRQRWTLLATIIGSGIVFLDGTIVNVALPRIGRDLPASLIGVLEGQTYVVSGYLAVLAALLIIGGALSDHYGRRRVFAIGLSSFGAVSVLCGFAPTLELLVIFRLLQGAAGALLVPGSLAIITQTFDGQQRARAFGIWAAATSALVVLGPITGGVLVDTAGWRVSFLVNVPLVLVALYATLRHVEESRDTSSEGRFDWLRDRAFATINLATFFIYGALYITQSYQGLLMQGVLGYTATAAGAIGLPAGIMLTLLSTRVGTLAGRIGGRIFLVAGPLIMAIGLLWFVRLPADSAAWEATFREPSTLIPPADVLIDVLPAMLLFGFGIALIVAPLTSTLMNSVPGPRAGLGSAINNAISRVGAPLIGAVIFIAISATFYAVLGDLTGLDANASDVRHGFPPLNPPTVDATEDQLDAAREASVQAFHQAMLVSAALLGIGGAVSFFGLRGAKAASGAD
jgi:MFS family permease